MATRPSKTDKRNATTYCQKRENEMREKIRAYWSDRRKTKADFNVCMPEMTTKPPINMQGLKKMVLPNHEKIVQMLCNMK